MDNSLRRYRREQTALPGFSARHGSAFDVTKILSAAVAKSLHPSSSFTALAVVSLAAASMVGGCRAAPSHLRVANFTLPSFVEVDGPALPVADVCVDSNISSIAPNASDLFHDAGFETSPRHCQWRIERSVAQQSLSDAASKAWSASDGSDERYGIFSSIGSDGALDTQIVANENASFSYAMRTLVGLARSIPSNASLAMQPGTIIDSPAFKLRGVVEGFYGAPYSVVERSKVLRTMSILKQNTYVYAPKGDRYIHEDWRTLYDSTGADAISRAEAEAAKDNINFVWGISPSALLSDTDTSRSIKFSSDADFADLMKKISSVQSLGVQRFGLYFDDTKTQLSWPEDVAKFASLASAHSYLINRVQEALSGDQPGSRLLVVGLDYTTANSDWSTYIAELETGLRSDVDVMWTGSQTFSDTIQASDLAQVDTALQRNVVLWDNYPLTVIPPAGRSVDLSTGAEGLLSNPILNEFGAQPLDDFLAVLGPLGDYEWNPVTYDATTSFARWKKLLSDSKTDIE